MSTEKQRRQARDRKRRERVRKGLALAPLDLADDLPPPPSREELLNALGVQARAGSIPACRLLLEEYRRDSSERPPDSTIDELAKRKQRRKR